MKKNPPAAEDSEGPGGCLAMSLCIAVLLLRLFFFLAYSYIACVELCAVTLLCVDLLLGTSECSCFKIQIYQLKKAKYETKLIIS